MANSVALNNISNTDLRIVRGLTPALNESLLITVALPFEFPCLLLAYTLLL
mgnify:CR=1 FL=1